MQNYASLRDTNDQDEEGGVLFHVAEPSRARWNHIEDLDSFFSRMYRYHQKHGFFCMVLKEVLELNQYVFVVILTTYLLYGVDYPVLFGDKVNNSTLIQIHKVTLSDAMFPVSKCIERISPLVWILLILAMIVFLFRLLRGIYQLVSFLEIKQFYNTALKIEDKDLDNLTWHEIQTRIRNVQLEQQMCIHKKELTDLDIYHRILRQQNYLVAMVNKQLLPPRIRLPFIGEIVYWTRSLQFNVRLLLFWTPWSPFENPWHLREEYRRANLRTEVASQLKKRILYLALINAALAIFIFCWQMLHTIFGYAELARRDPSSLSIRTWSQYGRFYLRHFNELDHELQARLSRAHRAATKYLSAFSSPYLNLLGQHLGFMFAAICGVFVVLAIYDEDILAVEHVIAVTTFLGVGVAVCRSLGPDDTIPWCPETLLTNVVAHTHYLPHNWKGQAHTQRIRTEFQQLFQYKSTMMLEELLSPILTPFFLFYYIYPRAIDIVDFFRHFTVSVVGVGDVCSFAQMNIKKHGNSEWHQPNVAAPPVSEPDQYHQAEDGKVELSLMHFHHTNPSWKPPEEDAPFVNNVLMESSLVASRNTGELMFHGNLDSSSLPYVSRMENPAEGSVFASGMWKVEGPNLHAVRDMSCSALYLHDQHHKQKQTSGRSSRAQAAEHTPLLSSN